MKKVFKVNDKYEITCTSENTRYGFRHLANLYRTGASGTTVLVEKAKECYYNRTWESFEYETVIDRLLTKAKIMPEEQIREFLECCRKNNLAEVNKQFGFIAGIAKIGEVLCETQSQKNDWKERMIKAGFGDKGLSMPDDWILLSEDEKERRLNNVIKEMEEKR
jgi:hypothetical protein